MLIIKDKKRTLQVIDRLYIHDEWITLLLVLAIILLCVLKLIKANGLLGYVIAFFTAGFIEKKTEKKESFFTPFNLLLFLFSMIVLSLFVYFMSTLGTLKANLSTFSLIFSTVTIYYLVRFFIDFTVSNILGLRPVISYFLYMKSGYLHTLSLLLFPIVIIYYFGFKNVYFLVVSFLVLFGVRGFLTAYNNKKLVVSKLFYFILYFCTLEIAPLLILYRLIKP